MTFNCIMALLGIIAFVFSGNCLAFLPVIFAIASATKDFEDLKQRVDWLEIKLKENENADR